MQWTSAVSALLAGVLGWSLISSARADADGPDHYSLRDMPSGEAVVLRAEPSPDADVVGGVSTGARCLRNLGCRGGLSMYEFSTLSTRDQHDRLALNPRWCRVEYQGRIGWLEGGVLAESATACDPAVGPSAGHRVERVSMSPVAGPTTITGSLKGREYVDYRVYAGAGQILTVSMTASNGQNHFNIHPPGTDVSMHTGSLAGRYARRILAADGEYTIRVYLMRAAERRGEDSRYTLRVGLQGRRLEPLAADRDALVADTPFHAAATIPCSMSLSPERRTCEAGVIRRGNDGTATLDVRWPEGAGERLRRILFVKGRPVAADSTEVIRHSRRGDRSVIRLGVNERFEIADALIHGG